MLILCLLITTKGVPPCGHSCYCLSPPIETFWLLALVLPGVCLLNVDVARRVVRCVIYFYPFLALDSRSVVLFSCLPSRFAQENASVARHESAHLPRPPLPLLLAHGTHKPNSFSYLPNTFFPPPTTIHLFFSRREAHFVYYFFFYKIIDGTRALSVFCLLFFFAAYFIFLLFQKKKTCMGVIGEKYCRFEF